jgi:hypothetical protein
MLGLVGTMAGLAGDAGQQKTTGFFIIPGRMAGKTFIRLFRLLQIYLKDGIYYGLSMTAV